MAHYKLGFGFFYLFLFGQHLFFSILGRLNSNSLQSQKVVYTRNGQQQNKSQTILL